MNPLVLLAAAFSPPPIDRMTLEVYAQRLAREDPGHVAWAVNHAIDNCKHFPRISDLLEFIRKRKVQIANDEDTAAIRRQLGEPRNEAPPKLMDLLHRQRERGGSPRKLL